jgi:hypothetical protein
MKKRRASEGGLEQGHAVRSRDVAVAVEVGVVAAEVVGVAAVAAVAVGSVGGG